MFETVYKKEEDGKKNVHKNKTKFSLSCIHIARVPYFKLMQTIFEILQLNISHSTTTQRKHNIAKHHLI